jgi:hypothetical protein
MNYDWLAWAFDQKLGTGEKLVLVYLAAQVSNDGVGRLHREKLAAATGYEARSLQRQLKTLRDAGLLHDAPGNWYSIGATPVDVPLQDLGASCGVQDIPGNIPADQPLGAIARELAVHLLGEFNAGKLGEELSEHVLTAGEQVQTMLAEFDRKLGDRLGHLLETLATVARPAEEKIERAEAAPAPPPDPVKESQFYRDMMTMGLTEDEAYPLAEKRLQADQLRAMQDAEVDTAMVRAMLRTAAAVDHPMPGQVIKVPLLADARPAEFRHYPDTSTGRAMRVWDILHPGKQPTDQSWHDIVSTWQRMEESENRKPVPGETGTPFDQVYPAIVQAARANVGKLPMREFMDEKAINAGRAPWDLSTGGPTEAQLLVELSTMLGEIERANHPQCQVPARTSDKEDGVTVTESTAQFHARVKRVHQQLKQLQSLGV